MTKNGKSSPETGDFTQNQLIADIAHELVVQIAPQELPVFRPISEAYFNDPEKTLGARQDKDDMLGFGIGAAVPFLTPVALAVATEVVRFVAEEVKKTARAEGSHMVRDLTKKMFKKFRSEEKEVPAPLKPEQLAQVRRMAIEKARQFNIPEDKAGWLADSIVGSLVVPV